jgi:hypothetical protein
MSPEADEKMRVPSVAIPRGSVGLVLEFLGVEVRPVCDGRQDVSNRVRSGRRRSFHCTPAERLTATAAW